MDTAFRWGLDPMGAAGSRLNVIPRAVQNQLTGKSFFEEPLDTPVRRASQAALDVLAPISVQSAVQAGRSVAPPFVQEAIPGGEARLGVGGGLFQATGLNLRAATNQQLRQLQARPETTSAERQQIDVELERRSAEFDRNAILTEQSFVDLNIMLKRARRRRDQLMIERIQREQERRDRLMQAGAG
jgi:hypothetical protein